ncbi:cupin [Gloeothece verrucosa]|uniref:Metal-dependent protein of the double-stranded beta helix superfamily n=1 Tax=Gloeothece verrucosa (strain PCC 7822) TaxID=497965 RepID=E0UKF3_GLOV7|nr:cupin [Gloeothece verrucosa]ADN17034.1 metal-dependent protein of the double-stranded beta helix superfamily [Gloeothece verrucosa PCC 7822]
MKIQDWLVTESGNCLLYPSPKEWDLLIESDEYRLYRFLTELEDIMNEALIKRQAEEEFLPILRRLVRKLLLKSYWVRTQVPSLSPEAQLAINMLYDEPGFPITIQAEIMAPGSCTSIHNHGTWGVVATLKGESKNIFWKRVPSEEFPDKIERVGEQILLPGEIISFTTEAIHSVEAIGDEPTITLNLYGDTNGSKRFEFDPLNHQAKKF